MCDTLTKTTIGCVHANFNFIRLDGWKIPGMINTDGVSVFATGRRIAEAEVTYLLRMRDKGSAYSSFPRKRHALLDEPAVAPSSIFMV